ncbi:MAG: ATP-binding protein [Emergencia sp.]
MYVDFMLFTSIALATNVVILIRIASSRIIYQEKSFMTLIILAICHNVIDLFWGLTYFDKLGMGPLGLQISTSLYFCSNALLAFTWFSFLYKMLHKDRQGRLVTVLSVLPMALVILMVIANIRTGMLFTIGETVDSYARGDWYIIERIGTTGYLIVIFMWSVVRFFEAKEKSERKRYSIITLFALVPMVFDMLQVYFVTVPCTSVAFQIAVMIVYVFISVERSENVLLSVSDRQKNNMKTALAHTSQSWYEFNVDRDCIYDSKLYINRDYYRKQPDQNEEKYSDYYDFLAGRVFTKYAQSYRETFSRENLKECFMRGDTELSLRYWITDSEGEELYIQQNIILTQDAVTKDIIGFAYTRDITAEERQKRDIEEKLEKIKALNTQLEKLGEEQERQNRIIEEARVAAEAANSAKTAFLFNMSHDIRTPMNAIIGFTDLLDKHQDEPEKRADYLKKIQDSSSVLLSIINNVLEMARIEKGTVEVEEAPWSVEQFNDTLHSVFQEMMVQKGIEFTRQIDVEHHYVFCDPIKLREVFINILSNAYKYTDRGGKVNMRVEEIPSDRAGYGMYRTTISDTGIGMSEEYLPHLFEEFSRENSMTDNKVEGTGLGMSIVERLVELMDGTIEVQSRKGEGTTFIVTIPHRIAEKSNLIEHDGVEINPELFRGRRILLAEDNDLNAEIAFEILKELGFETERAEDGQIAVNMVEVAGAGYYDLILMDIQMPNMNGYDATRTIRKLEDSEKAGIPIVAMTANAFEEDKREAVKAGMNGHLGKPVNVNELMKELARILK